LRLCAIASVLLACEDAAGPTEEPCHTWFRESFYTAGMIVPGGSSQVGTLSFSTYEVRDGPTLEASTLRRASIRWQAIITGTGVPSPTIIHVHGPGGSDTPVLYLGVGVASFSDGLPYVAYQGDLPFETLHSTLQAQTSVFDIHGASGPPVARGIVTRLIDPISGKICVG
jgi:hypothetical protein